MLEQQPFDRYWPKLEEADKLRIFWTVPSIKRMQSICTALKVYPLVLVRSRFLINPKDEQIGVEISKSYFEYINNARSYFLEFINDFTDFLDRIRNYTTNDITRISSEAMNLLAEIDLKKYSLER